MKSKQVLLAAILAGLTAFSAVSANALTDTQVKEIQKALKVPRLELPAISAQVVLNAAEKEREDVALTILTSVSKSHPASLAAVVGSICKAVPEIAPKIAAAAAKLLPQEIENVAKAAVAGAPREAEFIAAAVSKTAPNSAVKIVEAIIQIVPSAAPRVVATVGEAVPSVAAQLPKVRVTQQAAQAAAPFAVIVTKEGVIQGTTPTTKPTDVSDDVEAGADDDREDYGRPQ